MIGLASQLKNEYYEVIDATETKKAFRNLCYERLYKFALC